MNLEDSKRLIDELMKTNEECEKQNIALEMEIKASYKIIQKLKKDNGDKDDLIRKFEIGRTVAEKVIQTLKEELNVKEKEIYKSKEIIEEFEKRKSDKDAIEKNIPEICMENDLMERGLKAIKKETKKKNKPGVIKSASDVTDTGREEGQGDIHTMHTFL